MKFALPTTLGLGDRALVLQVWVLEQLSQALESSSVQQWLTLELEILIFAIPLPEYNKSYHRSHHYHPHLRNMRQQHKMIELEHPSRKVIPWMVWMFG